MQKLGRNASFTLLHVKCRGETADGSCNAYISLLTLTIKYEILLIIVQAFHKTKNNFISILDKTIE